MYNAQIKFNVKTGSGVLYYKGIPIVEVHLGEIEEGKWLEKVRSHIAYQGVKLDEMEKVAENKKDAEKKFKEVKEMKEIREVKEKEEEMLNEEKLFEELEKLVELKLQVREREKDVEVGEDELDRKMKVNLAARVIFNCLKGEIEKMVDAEKSREKK